MNPRLWWLWLILGLGVGLGVVGGGWMLWQVVKPHTFAGIVSATPVTDFGMVDETGADFALSDLRGQWILLAYGYTTCPDVCPATLAHFKQIKAALGPEADRVRVVFVSVDPERDTVAVMEQYVHHFGADFKGLTGTPEQVALAAAAFGAQYEKRDIETSVGYLVSHSAFIYLIDPQFNLRVTFPFGVKPAEMTADIQYLFQQEPNK